MRIWTTAELEEKPEPAYLLEPFLIDQGFHVLFGESGTFKTFLALSWALQVAEAHSTLYVAAEGAGSLRRRVAAWTGHAQSADRRIGWITEPVNMLDGDAVARLLDAIGQLDWLPALIVLDTLARCTAGGDENSTQEMGRAIAAIDQLRAQLGCAVLAVHHSGHGNPDRERGSSALRAAVDVSIRAKKTGTPLEVRLECAKARDTVEWPAAVVRMVQVDGSLVAASAEARESAILRRVRTYLLEHPGASQRQVEDHVEGRAIDVRAAFKQVTSGGASLLKERGRDAPTPRTASGASHPADALDGLLDPDEHQRLREGV